ncbi:hypothetical protein PAPYR_12144 [Paratrimastix pyriformis]|uniref:Uncharacterized protein n=1 Tax=Paratrimastix pyriformis TaxID=342808 RepID=A0ABQ8U2D7_9EUKA|nr:hypothetical protein PAPYR_12144 [Paratrimastix pyriformis]
MGSPIPLLFRPLDPTTTAHRQLTTHRPSIHPPLARLSHGTGISFCRLFAVDGDPSLHTQPPPMNSPNIRHHEQLPSFCRLRDPHPATGPAVAHVWPVSPGPSLQAPLGLTKVVLLIGAVRGGLFHRAVELDHPPSPSLPPISNLTPILTRRSPSPPPAAHAARFGPSSERERPAKNRSQSCSRYGVAQAQGCPRERPTGRAPGSGVFQETTPLFYRRVPGKNLFGPVVDVPVPPPGVRRPWVPPWGPTPCPGASRSRVRPAPGAT